MNCAQRRNASKRNKNVLEIVSKFSIRFDCFNRQHSKLTFITLRPSFSKFPIVIWILLTVHPLQSLEIACSRSDRRSVCSIDGPVNLADGEQLTMLPRPYPDAVRVFRLDAPSYLRSIPTSIFVTFPNLRSVILEAAGINHLASNQFYYAAQLTSLVLNSNSIRRLSSAVFATLPRLAFLVLSDNIIDHIDDHAFYGLSNLEELHLERNRVKVLRRNTFAGADQLQTLDLQTNEIETIEVSAFDLPRLTQLNLARNKIKVLPNDLCNVWSGAFMLEVLDLEFNHIRLVGEPLRNCHRLNDVHVDHNPVHDVNVTAINHLSGPWNEVLAMASLNK